MRCAYPAEFAKVFDQIEELKIQELEGSRKIYEVVEEAEPIIPSSIPTDWYRGHWVPKLATRNAPQQKTSIQNLLPEALIQQQYNSEAFRFVLNKWQNHPDKELKQLTNQLGLSTGTATWWYSSLRWFLIGGTATVGVLGLSGYQNINNAMRKAPSPPPTIPLQTPGDFTPIGIIVNSADGIVDDSPWDKAQVVAKFSNGFEAGDIIGIRASEEQKMLAVGNSIKVNGQEIATIAGGDNNEALQITFNQNANQDTVNLILQNLSYRNKEANAPEGTRSIEVRVIDAEGGVSEPKVYQVFATSDNQTPKISLTNQQPISIKEGDSLPIGNIQISDTEKGELEVTIKAEHGKFTVNDEKIAQNAKSLSISGDKSATLVIKGSIELVQEYLARETFAKYQSEAQFDGSESIVITVQDKGKPKPKDNNLSAIWKEEYLKPKYAEQKITVNVVSRNQPPTISLLSPIKGKAKSPILFGGISINDPDSKNVKVTLQVNSGKLEINSKIKNPLATNKVQGNRSSSLVLSGSPQEINQILANSQSVIYQDETPGKYKIDVQVDDRGKGSQQSLDVEVERVNSNPIWKVFSIFERQSPSPAPSTSPTPPPQAMGSISKNDAVSVVQQFMTAKSSIYGSSYDTSSILNLTTGNYQSAVFEAIDRLKSNGEYFKYGNQTVRDNGNFSSNGDDANIDIYISEQMTRYNQNGPIESETTNNAYNFTLKKENGSWKIAARRKL